MKAFPSFGSMPDAAQKAQFEQLPYYSNGQFRNLSPTPQLANDSSYWKIIREMMKKHPNRSPKDPLPSKWSYLPHSGAMPAVSWFGHSSYLVQAEGLNLLVDPVFSKRASFTQSMGPSAFPMEQDITMDMLPSIDYVLITHDHYDHLDHAAIVHLKDSVKHFYTPLGVGAHLVSWGVEKGRIVELAWWQSTAIADRFELIAAPARHFSGRGLKRNQTLWASYVLRSPAFNIYLGGDSGYDLHFADIGRKYGPFDIAILENGQYNPNWPFIHMTPEETVQAALDLKAKTLLPVHWGKFSLAMHPWNEPAQRVVKKAEEAGLPVVMPYLGERIEVGAKNIIRDWWR